MIKKVWKRFPGSNPGALLVKAMNLLIACFIFFNALVIYRLKANKRDDE